MTQTTFAIGQAFKHYNGYVWVITGITGKLVSMESKEGEQTIKAAMPAKDLHTIINAGYYKPIAI